MRPGSKLRGIWVDLLLVAACAAAFVWLAVPNLQVVRRRDERRRLRLSMRTLSTALESYRADHRAFPPSRPITDFVHDRQALRQAGGEGLTVLDPASLTTPVAYTEPQTIWDPFSPSSHVPLVYYCDGPGWILASPCVDGRYEIMPQKDYTSRVSQPSPTIILKSWDPTNGTQSAGDMFRVMQ